MHITGCVKDCFNTEVLDNVLVRIYDSKNRNYLGEGIVKNGLFKIEIDRDKIEIDRDKNITFTFIIVDTTNIEKIKSVFLENIELE